MLPEQDRQAIDALRERLRRAILNGDVREYLACLTRDATILHPGSPPVRGKEAVGTYLGAMFDAVDVTVLEIDPTIVDGGDGWAYEVATQECEVEPPLPGFERKRQHVHVYAKQDNGGWLLAAAMSGNR